MHTVAYTNYPFPYNVQCCATVNIRGAACESETEHEPCGHHELFTPPPKNFVDTVTPHSTIPSPGWYGAMMILHWSVIKSSYTYPDRVYVILSYGGYCSSLKMIQRIHFEWQNSARARAL